MPLFPPGTTTNSFSSALSSDNSGVSYVIAWISVENKQGEHKGVTVIWPTSLCLSVLPSSTSSHARPPLSHLPALPTQLQFSPRLALQPALIHAANPDQSCKEAPFTPTSRLFIRQRGCRWPTNDPLRTFRSLTLSQSRDINKVAFEVGSYVDAIAKERERERERIRRERENVTAASPKTPSALGVGRSVIAPDLTPGTMRNEGPESQYTAAATISSMPSQVVSSQISDNNFYPSPPQTNLLPSDSVGGMQTSPVVAVPPLPDVPNAVPPLLAPVSIDSIPPASATSFDPFGSLDTTWAQNSSNDFLDMDFEMGFHMNMDPMTGAGGSGSGHYDRSGMDYEDAFTDDDFSFFDRPSRTVPVDASTTLHNVRIGSEVTSTADSGPLAFPSPLFCEGLHPTGPGPPTFTSSQQPDLSPWASGDVFSPKFAENDGIHLDMLLPSPGQTPWPHSAPPSPSVQLSHDHARHESRRPSTSHGPSVFDPIPFAPSHRVSDGKYAVGKFALPSPPDEEDRTEAIPSSSPRTDGWQFRYNAVTDPRIGVVRKLIGVKRKSCDQGSREAKLSPSWDRERQDWGKCAENNLDNDKSEAESEDDVDENELPTASRPSTPLPMYLPLGPALLHTRFQHCQLLPLSTPLRPPGAAVAPTSIMSPPAQTSVPTPVSPAALIGAASEKSKSLEAAAYGVAREVVENAVWGRFWMANISRLGTLKQPAWQIWQDDVMVVKHLLENVPVLQNSLDIAALFQLGTSCMICPQLLCCNAACFRFFFLATRFRGGGNATAANRVADVFGG
jgi:mediator of RNA polymerase II transcription subunit 13